QELTLCLDTSLPALCRRLGCTVDELYDRLSPSGNWQLVGPSYAADGGHRTIGDLRLRELETPLRQLLTHFETDIRARFPEVAAQERAWQWLRPVRALVEQHLRKYPDEPLSELYRAWLKLDLETAIPQVRLASEHFAWRRDNRHAHTLLAAFLRDYPALRQAYNSSLTASHSPLTPLKEGELPFFVIFRRGERMTRFPATWQDGFLGAGACRWRLPPSPEAWPWEQMAADGVIAVSGKAVVMVNQVRSEGGAPLALPRLGSLYMPTAYELARRLMDSGVAIPHPVLRVRFRFLERWQGVSAIVRLPKDLADCVGVSEGPAGQLAPLLLHAMREAGDALHDLAEPSLRPTMLARRFQAELAEIHALQEAKRMAATQGNPDYRGILARIKSADRKLADAQVAWIASLVRLRDLTFFDSRGALLPWALALGGEPFYQQVLAQAEISEEQ
ncbi:MAG: hypothetical protein IJJ33_00110, partial [Victivallales bacterium]|nr:hypothetical protein [Victivallales bacterium]